MNRIILLIVSALLLTSCVMDSIERRNDFSTSSYSIDDMSINITFRGTEWDEYEESGKKVSEWVGPYKFYVFTSLPVESEYRFTVSSAKIKYADGTTIKSISSINMETAKSWKEGIKSTAFIDSTAIKLKYNPIIVELNTSYIENGQSYSNKITLLVKPTKTEREYNSFWAALMSV